MENQNKHDDVKKHSMRSVAEKQARRPYRSPSLVEYGDLSSLTAGGGGRAADAPGGAHPPLTKA